VGARGRCALRSDAVCASLLALSCPPRCSLAPLLSLRPLTDTNGDGEVSLDEFIKIMMRPVNGKPTEFEESELVAMFMDMDHDGGGTVCYDEFALAWAAEGEELGIASAGNDGYPDEGK
jgi:hypothetical protein